MAKKDKESKKEEKESLSSDARKQRAALHANKAKKLSESQKRDAFRVFWAQKKSKYGKSKDLEHILWLHLKAVKMDEPEMFEEGVKHFGLEKVK